MPLNLTGPASLSSLTISRPGSEDDADTLVTLKLEIETTDLEPIQAALGAESPDRLAWAHDSDGERAYMRLGAIACGADWRDKHSLELAGYRDMRPVKVTVESVAPAPKSSWLVALKVQVESPPAGAVEAWAQYLRTSMRMVLKQDEDLLSDAGGVRKVAKQLDALLAEDGTTATLSSGGEVLAKFGRAA